MADNKIDELARITERETAEFTRMSEILAEKQTAVAKLDTSAVGIILTEELKTLNEIRSIERRRAEVLNSLSLTGDDLDNPMSLEKKIGRDDAEKYAELHLKLKKAFDRMRKLNDICRILLLHSLTFIRQNIRILTDDGRRKLVDKKA